MMRVVLGLVILFMIIQSTCAKSLRISTKFGTLYGRIDDAIFNGSTKQVAKFLGVPFAEPPIGNLRFRKPVPKAMLQGTYNATYHRPACMQVDFRGGGSGGGSSVPKSEDCLYLNIYIPYEQKTGINGMKNKNYSVMIWIYGGAFLFGNTESYDGSVLSASNDVIVVTVSYRVNVFGFLSTHDSASRGNYGLWDQHLGIKWVHDNIADYGGDPNSVTIFGESAGSSCVLYQAIYSGNKGLFQNVIAESGAAASPWAFSKPRGDMDQFVRTLSDHMGCSNMWSQTLVACLRNKSAAELIRGMMMVTSGAYVTPVADGDFVIASPTEILETDLQSTSGLSHKALDFFRSLNAMVGLNSQDGTTGMGLWVNLVHAYNNKSVFTDGVPRFVFKHQGVPKIVKRLFSSNNSALQSAIVHEYTKWSNPNDAIGNLLMGLKLDRDYGFLAPTVKTLDAHSKTNKHGSSYMYVFSHQTPYLMFPRPPWFQGAGHGDEINYVFGLPSSKDDHSNVSLVDEVDLSARVMKIWTNFAKSGNPDAPVSINFGERWPEYESTNRTYLDINTDMEVKKRYEASHVDFWLYVIPEILKHVGIANSAKQNIVQPVG